MLPVPALLCRIISLSARVDRANLGLPRMDKKLCSSTVEYSTLYKYDTRPRQESTREQGFARYMVKMCVYLSANTGTKYTPYFRLLYFSPGTGITTRTCPQCLHKLPLLCLPFALPFPALSFLSFPPFPPPCPSSVSWVCPCLLCDLLPCFALLFCRYFPLPPIFFPHSFLGVCLSIHFITYDSKQYRHGQSCTVIV